MIGIIPATPSRKKLLTPWLRTTASNANTTFKLFSEFPEDIRRMVWKVACPGPRILAIEVKKLADEQCIRVWSDTKQLPQEQTMLSLI